MALYDVTKATLAQLTSAASPWWGFLSAAGKQELSYRKKIARQLRTQMTQYVEGIYRPNYPVTLKSGLKVTQGH